MKFDRQDEFLLVETLPETTYHHGHLPGAINFAPEKVAELALTLPPDKQAEIVVYCASPTLVAVHELAALGYTNVRDFAAGKQDDAALPVEATTRIN